MEDADVDVDEDEADNEGWEILAEEESGREGAGAGKEEEGAGKEEEGAGKEEEGAGKEEEDKVGPGPWPGTLKEEEEEEEVLPAALAADWLIKRRPDIGAEQG